ncbi:MAG TPA: lipid-A-disaccharide synthase, partial [Coxiellaceae bacterium]|nr:lipid-A-disaccharide synthase [Coxiellaceae bacterium]
MPNSSQTPHILIIAGETSGDRLGAHLVQAMTEQDPTLTFTGFGGDLMQAAGVDILMHSQELAIIGLIEVIKKQETVRR